jgi:acyl transferase domain-containing protein
VNAEAFAAANQRGNWWQPAVVPQQASSLRKHTTPTPDTLQQSLCAAMPPPPFCTHLHPPTHLHTQAPTHPHGAALLRTPVLANWKSIGFTFLLERERKRQEAAAAAAEDGEVAQGRQLIGKSMEELERLVVPLDA